jgi:hypothetical protein
MLWKRSRFRIATASGTRKVAGVVSPIGLGLHRATIKPDPIGRYGWTVTHLNTGYSFARVRGKDEETAGQIADLLESVIDWNAFKTIADFEADPEWVARVIGIKHTLGGDWIELLNPAMNDAKNLVWLDDKMTKH